MASLVPRALRLSPQAVAAALEQPRAPCLEAALYPVPDESPVSPPASPQAGARSLRGSGYSTVPAIGRQMSSRWPTLLLPRAACALLLVQSVALAVGAWHGARICARLRTETQENRLLEKELAQLRRRVGRVRNDTLRLRKREGTLEQELEAALAASRHPRTASLSDAPSEAQPAAPNRTAGLYKAITGLGAHQQPEFYGKVAEKTIWSYWYHPVDCPSSKHCKLPTVVGLCAESIEKNRGGFDYRIVHRDEVEKYVTRIELPIRWRDLKPAQQKDSLMNALLARYGGVAMDISTILLRPLDSHWDEMVANGATFRGYVYRLNGRPWRHAEVAAVWFLMSRREGIFTTAVRNQVIGMGDRPEPSAYHHWYLALGDQTLLPILTIFNYSLPKCYDDPTVNVDPSSKLHQFDDQNPRMCPEHEQQPWYKGLTGPARNDTRLFLEDPRDGPQLPFAFEGMAAWRVDDAAKRSFQRTPGSPMQDEACSSMKECWENVVLRRYRAHPEPGRAPMLSFVKLFKHAAELERKSRQEILSDTQTYLYQLLKLAGVAQNDSQPERLQSPRAQHHEVDW